MPEVRALVNDHVAVVNGVAEELPTVCTKYFFRRASSRAGQKEFYEPLWILSSEAGVLTGRTLAGLVRHE
ncbi:hypothetical protein XarzCFBP7410_07590 [Xanthomonas arboricola pv. zantedeschiae]|nr:hypothetical protein XarzCFBP7410_07590 [Xanthomonas arboricola pv. zantedeschiae]